MNQSGGIYLGFWAAVTGSVLRKLCVFMTERIYDKGRWGARSRCPGCGHTPLGVMELIPVFSFDLRVKEDADIAGKGSQQSVCGQRNQSGSIFTAATLRV